MTGSYVFRLVCLSLEAFFLVHLVLATVVTLIAPAAIRMARRLRPRLSARFLLALRLFPAGFALLIVIGLCVPSYLSFEPESTSEHVGYVCLGAAVLAGLGLGNSMNRAVRAGIRSRRYIQRSNRVGEKTLLAGESAPVWIVDGAGPILALAGIVHPRIIVSREVVSVLSTDQTMAAVRHERAHATSRDNLKRLLLVLAPDILPFVRTFGKLERAWAKSTEWAADDGAVAGNYRRSLSLAEALVRISRLSGAQQAPLLVTSIVGDRHDLSERVERLLATPSRENPRRALRFLIVSITIALAGFITAAMLQPATLYSGHRLLERLIR